MKKALMLNIISKNEIQHQGRLSRYHPVLLLSMKEKTPSPAPAGKGAIALYHLALVLSPVCIIGRNTSLFDDSFSVCC